MWPEPRGEAYAGVAVDAALLGRGAGEGLGVHICTGPVAITGAEPGDILEVRILDLKLRPCANPTYKGKSFGSNAAAGSFTIQNGCNLTIVDFRPRYVRRNTSAATSTEPLVPENFTDTT